MKNQNRKTGGFPGDPLCVSEDGFTLLEVLLAFFIFSILFITIFTSYSSSFKTVSMTESRMELYRKAAIALQRISEDLQTSYVSGLQQDTLEQPAGFARFLGEDADFNGRDADALSFFSMVPPLFSKENETTSGLLISYSVIQGSGEDELVLLRSENPQFIDQAERREGLVLADGLQAINFTYFDEKGEEHENWDSQSEEFGGRPPRRVLISLEFLNDENPEEPFMIMTGVALPVSYVPQL